MWLLSGDANAASVPAQHRDSMPENRDQKPFLDRRNSGVAEGLSKSRELLKELPPGTFPGRQHRDMIPLPEQEE